jgi:CTP synthase (UTP-ammonia lyase)
MRVTGWDEQGEIRAAELVTHPFFVITLFQHERAALDGRPVVLAQAMLRAARGKKADLPVCPVLSGV